METDAKPVRDLIGAGLMVVLGIVVVVAGASYQMGTLVRMGAGYVPVVIGSLMIFVGVLIGLTARAARGAQVRSGVVPGLPTPPKHGEWAGPQWRGWSCILGGVAAFVVLGHYGGLVPATFFAVFISALGDRDNSLRDCLLLAVGITIAGVAIFSWGLKLVFPLFSWG